MKLLDRIKDWMGRRRLVREAAQERRPVARNLASAAKVGIIYQAKDEASHQQVRNYVKKIKEDLGIHKIMALGFVDEKALPHYMAPKLHFDAFCQKDLNWYRIPGGNTVNNFITEEHEVLIDLTMDDVLPVQYILAKSRARFKVGRFGESNRHFLDMMIDMAGSQSLPQLITQVDHYLLMINRAHQPSLN